MILCSTCLSKSVNDGLEELCQRIDISLSKFLGHVISRLVEVDRSWRSSGMAGVTPDRFQQSDDPYYDSESVRIVFEVSDDVAKGYGEICERLDTSPDALLLMMATGLIDQDNKYLKAGRGGIGAFHPPGYEHYALESAVEHGIYPATGQIRPGTGLVWPVDKPFPLSDAQCAALVRGHLVRWGGTKDEYLTELPGKYELIEGFLRVHET